jgi:FkbM family methyltransferase
MRIWSSIFWRVLALARIYFYKANSRLFGVEVPPSLVPFWIILGQLDQQSYEAKESRYIQAHLSVGAEVPELGASPGIVFSIILGCRPSRLISYEAVGSLAETARQVVAHNHPKAPWTLVSCAIAGEGIDEVSFVWSPKYTLGGFVASELAKAHIRVPAESVARTLARHQLPTSAWLVMNIEGMEWQIARGQATALRHFAGIIIECHGVHEDGLVVPHRELLVEVAKVGFDVISRRGQVSVLRCHAA